MINDILINAGNFLEEGYWGWCVVLFIFGAFYLFWRGVKLKCENESFALEYHLTSSYNRSLRIFDFLFIVLVTTVLIGRLMLVFSGVDLFLDSRWFWLPYEKIQDQVYIMQAFPWLFFNFSIGGLLLEGVMVGLITAILVYSWLLNLKLIDFIEPISSMVRFVMIGFLAVLYVMSLSSTVLYLLVGVLLFLVVTIILKRFRSFKKYTGIIDLLNIFVSFSLFIVGPYVFRFVWGYEGVNNQFVDLVWMLGSGLTIILLIIVIYRKVKIISKKSFGKIRSRIYNRRG